MRYAGFEWDEGNREKCQSHSVSLAEIELLFGASLAVRPDINHSHAESRFFGIGQNRAGRYVFVAFTIRRRGGKNFIRPISARYMHRKEVDRYEQVIS